MASRPLIGRTDELRQLDEALLRGTQGQPQLVFLSGDAGVGKTRLCRTFLQEHLTEHTLILSGQAIPQDQGIPFGLFIDAFRRFFATTTGESLLSHPLMQNAFCFLPQLERELAPALGENEHTRPSSDASVIKPRNQPAMFYHILKDFYSLAQAHQGPIVLLLEDLHWADVTSLDLLAFLVQRLEMDSVHHATNIALLMLGTYRSETLSDTPALKRLLFQLHSQRLVYQLSLAPFSRVEHHQRVEQLLDQSLPEHFTRALFAWDEGNPFFTEELVESLITTRQLCPTSTGNGWSIPSGTLKPHLPTSLTSAIHDRLALLPAPYREVLSYAAVVGRVFDFPLLTALCDISEHKLITILRAAVHAQIITEVEQEQTVGDLTMQVRYQFRHALIREAIYGQMLLLERRRAHQRVAETLERLAAPATNTAHPHAERHFDHLLAEHYWAAGLVERARPAILREIAHARRIFAFREERYYLQMAQACFPAISIERLQLLHRLGMVSMAIFDCEQTLHWLTLARDGYQQRGDRQQMLRVQADMLLPNWFLAGRSFPELLMELEMSLDEVKGVSDDLDSNSTEELSGVCALIAMMEAVDCQFERANLWVERSRAALAGHTGPARLVAEQICSVADGWSKAHQHTALAQAGIARIRDAITIARQESLPDVILFGYGELMMTLIYRGYTDERGRISLEVNDFELQTGTMRYSFLFGWQQFFSGDDWDRAIELLHWDISRMVQGHVPALVAISRVALAHILLTRNEQVQAHHELHSAEPALTCMDQYTYLMPLWWGFARLASVQGQFSEAQTWYERILKRWRSTGDRLLIVPVLLDSIILSIDTKGPLAANRWLVELEKIARSTDNPISQAALQEVRGRIAQQEGRIADALQYLRQATKHWRGAGWRYRYAQSSQQLAQVLIHQARAKTTERKSAQAMRMEAEQSLDQAINIYTQLHLPADLAAIETMRADARLVAQQKRRATLMQRNTEQGLTRREVQVLALLATGNSNKEIAQSLNISIGTVETHVSHILTKLNCETRTQAVAYAIKQDFVSTQ